VRKLTVARLAKGNISHKKNKLVWTTGLSSLLDLLGSLHTGQLSLHDAGARCGLKRRFSDGDAGACMGLPFRQPLPPVWTGHYRPEYDLVANGLQSAPSTP
jgi:hypothetical protein